MKAAIAPILVLIRFGCLIAVLFVSTAMLGQTTPPRDTIVIVKRDTVVIMRKDTVMYQVVEPAPRTRAEEYTRSREEQQRAIEEERQDRLSLREQRVQEYEEWVAAQPEIRSAGITRAVKFYPSRLLRLDFPSFTLGIEQTVDGRYGLEATAGLAIKPSRVLDFNGGDWQPGTARFGLRGFNVGAEGRYYFSQKYKAMPFYLGVGIDYSLSPIDLNFWVPVNGSTFEQYEAAPVNAQDFNVSVVSGWQLRTKEGFILDVAPGLRFGVKGLYSNNEGVTRAIENRYWNLFNGGRTPYADIVLRVGFGKGTWTPKPIEASAAEPSKRKSTPQRNTKKRKKKRGRRG